MKKLFCLMCVAFVSIGFAKNDIVYMDIKEAMGSPKAKEELHGDIEFKFGKGSGSADKIIKSNLTSNKKTNGAGKSDKDSCTQAFLSALITFQERARKEGGTKVVNLTGYFKKQPYDSTTQFQCAIGGVMTAVTLKGDIAK